MRTTHRSLLALGLALSAVTIAACTTESTAVPAPQSRAGSLPRHVSPDQLSLISDIAFDLSESGGLDTTRYFACEVGWGGCDPLTLTDAFQLDDTINYLQNHSSFGCRFIGQELANAKNNGRILKGKHTYPGSQGWTTGASGNAFSPSGYTVISPAYSFAFENRALIVHEAMHMAQFDGYGTYPIQPWVAPYGSRGNESTYEPEARAMESECN
jgi:hypothetical protein